MNNEPHDINDDEIRIISSESKESRILFPNESKSDDCGDDLSSLNYVAKCACDGFSSQKTVIKKNVIKGKPRNRWTRPVIILATLVIIALTLTLAYCHSSDVTDFDDDDASQLVAEPGNDICNLTEQADLLPAKPAVHPHIEFCDTTSGNAPLIIMTPVDATPKLYVGTDILDDSTAILVVQAADVRGDNGEIVGAYVKEGQLLSKGQTKSGFCAIIGGKPTVGVADSTPFLEQALESDGYFFRQYPLVVGNQIVENKPKGKALRKALAELNGRVVVIMSKEKMTFHDFSQSLVDLGVTNAIYLVGSTSYGFATDDKGNKVEFGTRVDYGFENVNYIAWK